MTILITGSTGFIGRELNKKNHFRSVVRDTSMKVNDLFFVIDQFDRDTDWNNAFVGIESVIHLAGLAHSKHYLSEDYQTVNVDGTLHFAKEAARAGVKRFVFVSSIGVNGTCTEVDNIFSADSIPFPHNLYAQSKYKAELGLKEISETTGLELVIVRPTLVYGVNAPGNFGLLTNLVNRLPILPFGSVDNKRDFIAVQNLSDLLINCAKHPNASGHTFLASDGKSVSIKDFTNAIAIGLNKTVFQIPIPICFIRFCAKILGRTSVANQLLDNLQVDSSSAKNILGWTPPFSMEQAMTSLSGIQND